jgi:hypothetical protein
VTDSCCKPASPAELIRPAKLLPLYASGTCGLYDGAVGSPDAAHPSAAAEILGTVTA